MRDVVEIGLSKSARRGYHLDDIAIVPTRRTRDVDDVSTAWQIDAFRFEIPLVTSPSDAVVSPATAIAVGRAGGLGVLNAEGLWTRYDDPERVYRRLRDALSTRARLHWPDLAAVAGLAALVWAFLNVDQFDGLLYPWGAVGIAGASMRGDEDVRRHLRAGVVRHRPRRAVAEPDGHRRGVRVSPE